MGGAALAVPEPSASTDTPRPARGLRLGELLVKEGLVTRPQIDEALRMQANLDRYVPLGHVLIAQRLISRDQLVAVLERHRRSTRLGDLLVKSGEISQEQLETALAEQRRAGQPLGATLMRLNMVTEERLRLALCRQLHIRFFNLDAIIIDPTLRGLVNERFALKYRVVPLARVSNTLVAAMDDPTMTRVVDDLHRSTGLRIEVITSTAAPSCNDFSQHEVDTRVGNSFAQYLRSFLRHDPEVIMIGEIRDSETAELAFRAAQTGHFIISTLHTNDAVGAVNRLKDLGVDANVCTSSLLGVMAQRLVRQICWNCKQQYEPPRQLLESVFDVLPTGFAWHRGAGCDECHHSGYKGRLLISELWTPSERDVMLINDGASFDAIQESASKSTIAMADDVLGKLRDGRITLEEVIRAVPHSTMKALRATLL